MQVYSANPLEIGYSIWRNKWLIGNLVAREIQGRYKGSTLGLAWSFIIPLVMLSVYTFVFGDVFKARWRENSSSKAEFALILFAGLIVFNLFSECINKSPGLILSNINYVKKVVFPLEVLPVVDLITSLYHAAISLLLWVSAYYFLLGNPQITILYLPIIIIPECLLILGVAWTLASLGVYLRDISQVVGIITTILMFLSPIFYPIESIPKNYQFLFKLNPLSPMIEQVRDVLFFGKLPQFSLWLYYTIVCFLIFLLGFIWFQKTRKGFADVI